MLVSQIGPSLLPDLKNGTKLFFKTGFGVGPTLLIRVFVNIIDYILVNQKDWTLLTTLDSLVCSYLAEIFVFILIR